MEEYLGKKYKENIFTTPLYVWISINNNKYKIERKFIESFDLSIFVKTQGYSWPLGITLGIEDNPLVLDEQVIIQDFCGLNLHVPR